MAYRNFLMVIFSQDNIDKESLMAKVNTNGLMALIIKEFLLMALNKVMESGINHLNLFMKDSF